jgi:uncharacterized protein
MKSKTNNILLVFGLSLTIFIVQFIIGLAEGLLMPNGNSQLNEVLFDFIIDLVLDVLTIIVILKILKSKRSLNLRSLIKLNEITIKYIAISVMGAVLIFFVDYSTKKLISFPPIQIFDDIYAELKLKTISGFNLIILFTSYSIITPITEEIFIRGFVFTMLRRDYTFISSMLLTFIVFSFFHLDPRMFVLLFVANIILCYIYDKKRNLLYPIIIHVLYNMFALIYYYYENIM